MGTWTLEFRLETPALIQGEDKTPELRLPAVLSGLRQAWRMMDAPHEENEMRVEEARLFGWAASDSKGGQGQFLPTLKIAGSKPMMIEGAAAKLVTFSGRHGPVQIRKTGIAPKSTFNLDLAFSRLNRPSDTDQEKLTRALDWFGAMGAIGYASRRGFGSAALTGAKGVPGLAPPSAANAYEALVRRRFLKAKERVLPSADFPRVSSDSCLWIARGDRDFAAYAAAVDKYAKSQNRTAADVFSDQDGSARKPSPLLVHLRQFEQEWVWTLLLLKARASASDAADRAAAFAKEVGAHEVEPPR